jgi:hypothetical protein
LPSLVCINDLLWAYKRISSPARSGADPSQY